MLKISNMMQPLHLSATFPGPNPCLQQ